MRYSKMFPKAKREVKAESKNHELLVQAGFMDQLMAGSWTLLPLGWRVITKINDIIREEMNKADGQELLMPLLHPKSIWNETDRWDKADEIMYKLKDTRGKEFALSFTHEEIVMDLLRKNINSYKDLPVAVYHFSTKFRNELRAKSGILRGREFMMKDLYSAHTTEEDLMKYYFKILEAYKKIFDKLGMEYRVTEADGGVFTDKNTHEVQVLSEVGEDTIYYCDKCEWGANSEIDEGKSKSCPKCKKGSVITAKSIEVGNIFPLGTMYAEKMKVSYMDKKGNKKPVWFGSYGIGPTRVMGTLVEVFHDEKGIVWPESVAPFRVHLVSLGGVEKKAEVVYKKLLESKIEVLFDDRDDVGAGAKFGDADLIGCTVRLVVSKKTGDKVEMKMRSSDQSSLLSIKEAIEKLSK